VTRAKTKLFFLSSHEITVTAKTAWLTSQLHRFSPGFVRVSGAEVHSKELDLARAQCRSLKDVTSKSAGEKEQNRRFRRAEAYPTSLTFSPLLHCPDKNRQYFTTLLPTVRGI
jgi:hypothetical protein